MEPVAERCNKIVLVPLPFQGHITPMLQIGTLLYSKGFSISVVHMKFNAPNASSHPEFMFVPLDDSMSELDTSSENLLALCKTFNEKCESSLQIFLEEQQQDPNHQVVCVIYDTMMYCAESVANRLNIPNIVLRTGSPSFMLSAFNIPRLQEQGFIPLKDSTLEDFVPGLCHLRFKDLPLHKTDFDDIIKTISILRSLKSVSAILYNTVEHLESSSLTKMYKYDQIPYFTLGPLHKMAPSSSTSLFEEDSSCKTWLDKQAPNSVLYVSLGSLATMDQKELTEMAWGLATSGQFVLWVVRPGSILDSEWVEFLPKELDIVIGDRIFITKWAPQKVVLGHSAVCGFWTHCGWNSTLETISEGVPVICRPSFGDQYVNSRYLTYVWKVGLECGEDLKRGEIKKVIRRLMVDEEGREMRQRANDIMEKIKICTTKSGSSKKALDDLVEFIMSYKYSK